MAKWYFKKYALEQAKKNPDYYKNKKLVRTTRVDWDGNRKKAWKWVEK